jgi:hypothetical protein
MKEIPRSSAVKKLSVSVSSPPDRNYLVADFFCENEQWAELNQEGERLSIEIYPKRSGEPWILDFEEVFALLSEGKRRLVGND